MSRKIRINRGALLFIILLIGIITYLVVLSVTRGKDEALIKDLCSDYITIETQYDALPEKYRSDGIDMPAEELNNYINDMKDAIKLYFIDNENAYGRLINSIESSLIRQAGGGAKISKFTKNIIAFTEFEYRGDVVEVSMQCQNQFEIISDSNSVAENNYLSDDSIIVQKVDGKWKVVYSNVKSPFDISGDYFGYY